MVEEERALACFVVVVVRAGALKVEVAAVYSVGALLAGLC